MPGAISAITSLVSNSIFTLSGEVRVIGGGTSLGARAILDTLSISDSFKKNVRTFLNGMPGPSAGPNVFKKKGYCNRSGNAYGIKRKKDIPTRIAEKPAAIFHEWNLRIIQKMKSPAATKEITKPKT